MINSGTNLTHFSIIFLTHVAKHFLRSTPLTGNKDVPQANGKGVGSINPPPPAPQFQLDVSVIKNTRWDDPPWYIPPA